MSLSDLPILYRLPTKIGHKFRKIKYFKHQNFHKLVSQISWFPSLIFFQQQNKQNQKDSTDL